MTISDSKKNYALLYRGIAITRDALLQFIKNCLQGAYRDEAWERGVKRVFRAEDIEKLEIRFNKRFASPAGPSRPGSDLFEILDINYFINIIEGNWKQAFSVPLNGDKTILFFINEIVLYRNPVAHPETGDLRDDDTFRGLDTSERILRLIDRDAASQIQDIKKEFRSSWVQQGVKVRSLSPEEVAIDIDRGLEKLEKEMLGLKDHEAIEETFRNAKENLLKCLEQEKLETVLPAVLQQKENSLTQLDQLSYQILGEGFTQACTTIPAIPLYSREEAADATRKLRKEIRRLKDDLVRLERQRRWEQGANTIVPFTEREINRTKQNLKEHENQYEQLEKQVFPPAFFEIERKLRPSAVREENKFTVEVHITNLGKRSTRINYEDSFDNRRVSIIGGSQVYNAQIGSGETKVFSYSCTCQTDGLYQIFTRQIAYDEKVAGWDTLKETTFNCQKGKKPQLNGIRYFRYTPKGIEVIIRLNNKGDKVAHNVSFSQEIRGTDTPAQTLKLSADLAVNEEKVVKCEFNVISPSQIEFPKSTTVTYLDNNDQPYTLTLEKPFELLQYIFPPFTPLVGREGMLEQIRQVLESVKAGNNLLDNRTIRKVIFVEGEPGIGKSRLLAEFGLLANQIGILCYQEDATSRSPIKRVMRQVLGLNPDETNRDLIWEILESRIPESESVFRQRAPIVEFIASQLRNYSAIEIDKLQADAKLLISKLCSTTPIFLIFENIQRIPEGIELELFKAFVSLAANYPDLPLMICASYRPIGVSNLPMQLLDRGAYGSHIKIQLNNLTKEQTNSFVNQLISFPQLSQELQDFVYNWSQGNPLFIREILRHLTSKEMIRLIGNEWYPSKDFVPSAFQPQMNDLILDTAKTELGENIRLLRLLSIIGLDFSWSLLIYVVQQTKDINIANETELLGQLASLEKAGFIKTSSHTPELQYEFEHQAKREAIYTDPEFPIDVQTLYREKIVSVLLESGEKIFPDKEEYNRQIARHLLNASSKYKIHYRNLIRLAAEEETRLRNFPRAVEYYSALLLVLTGHQYWLEQAEVYFERGRIYKWQAKVGEANQDLLLAESIVSEARKQRQKRPEINDLYSGLLVERAGVLLLQKDTLKANDLLWKAHREYEGIVRQRRFFPPKSRKYYDGIIEIYLGLVEIWLSELDTRWMKVSFWRTPFAFNFANNSEIYRRRAENYAKHAKKVFLGDNRWLIKVYLTCGELYRRLGTRKEKQQAIEWLNLVLKVIQESQSGDHRDIYSEERALSLLAEIYREQNMISNAQDYYEKARVLQEKLQDFMGLGITYGGIGDLLVEQSDFDSAQYYLEKAFEYQKSVGDTERYWRTCKLLVKVNLLHGNYEGAYSYWELSSDLVFGRLNAIQEQELHKIFLDIQALAKHYKKQENWTRCKRLYRDMLSLVNSDHQKIEIDLLLGEIYIKTNEMNRAIETLQNGLEVTADPLAQAEIHSLLGDAFATIDENQIEALDHYKESTKIYLSEKLNEPALDIYEKLIERASAKDKNVPQITDTLFSLVEVMLSKQSIDERFIQQAEKILEDKGRFQEAGDLFVNAVMMVGGLADGDFAFKKRIVLLQKAERIYPKSKHPGVIMSGLNKLISAYFSLGQWEKVTEHFVSLLNLCAKRRNTEEFIITFKSIVMLQHKIPASNFENILDVVVKLLKKKKGLNLDNNKKASVLLSIAKGYSHLSDRGPAFENKFGDLALSYYEELLRIDDTDSIRGVYLNDTALIYLQKGNISEAERRLNECISIQNQEPFNLACRKFNLASLLYRTFRMKTASIYFEDSVKEILGRNAYWDQRKENENNNPFSLEEVGAFTFEKNWAASACRGYGFFTLHVNKDIGKAMSYMNTGMNICLQIGNLKAAEEIRDLLVQLQSQIPLGDKPQLQIPTMIPQYRSCPSCQKPFEVSMIVCPQCGVRSCPYCANIQTGGDEYCEICDRYLGL